MVDIAQYVSEVPTTDAAKAKGDWTQAAGAALANPTPAAAANGGEQAIKAGGKVAVAQDAGEPEANKVGEAAIGKQKIELGEKGDFKKHPLTTREALANALEDSVSNVTRNFIRNGLRPDTAEALAQEVQRTVQDILSQPQWDQRFRQDIRSADQALANHPQIDQEIMKAGMQAKKTSMAARQAEKVYGDSFAKLPPDVQKKLNQWEEMKGGSEMVDQYLAKFYPDVYQNRMDMNKAQSEEWHSMGALQKLCDLKDAPNQARMDRAEFLLQRGGKADTTAAIELLGQIVDKDPSAAVGKGAIRFRDLVQRSGALEDPVFLKILKDNKIDPETLRDQKAKIIDGKKPMFLPHFDQNKKLQKQAALDLPDMEIA